MQENPDGLRQLEGTAYHEAGHAIVALLLGFSVESAGIDLNGGYCIWNETLYVSEDRFPESWAAVNLAGSIAREIATGEPDSGQLTQDELAVRSLSVGPEGLEELLGQARSRAEEILQNSWPLVQVLARALLKYRRLQGEQIQDIIMGSIDGGETISLN
ncbi:hypothetical protein NITHO_3180004 [Nitrolancea hollandica Lb]|uniref:Peptidase M41 domain-containing protein n=2 Tax=Nitrolancea hollandica TaxID=1206749 RepID=I4EHM3_9BACT|nr:hypothetical protein NITHO_3180004 [Nitrolancea hollandica Lb]